MNTSVAIIGSGPSGMGAARWLDRPYIVFEKEAEPGGLLRSRHIGGFTFDYAGHIFFNPDPAVEALLLGCMEGNHHTQTRRAAIFSQDVFTHYPFQSNTFGLPIEVVKACILGFVQALHTPRSRAPKTMAEWIEWTYGPGIAEHFMLPYNQKLWAMPLERISCEWVHGRVPQPSLEEVLDGALRQSEQKLGPNARFHYPLRGGAATVAGGMFRHVSHWRQGMTLTAIKVKDRAVELNGGKESCAYEDLVLTVPLPEAVKLLDTVPAEVQEAVDGLHHLSVLCVNIGAEGPGTEKHWVYYPEKEFLCQRIFVQSNASRLCAPEGCSSFTHEISHSEFKKVDFATAIERSVADLVRCRFIDHPGQVRVTDMVNLPYGYVVYTEDRLARVGVIRKWLASQHIHLVGRFAEWEYYNSDHSMMAGKRMAEQLNQVKGYSRGLVQ